MVKNILFLSILFLHFNKSLPQNNPAIKSTLLDTITDIPSFSMKGGIYLSSISISLSVPSNTDSIYYTLDGSEPDKNSTRYTSPVSIDSNTAIRARIIRANWIPGKIETKTYLIGRNYDLPVIALTTPPGNLWDYDTGIYVAGPNAQAENPHFGANYWMDWERPVHIELFDTDTTKFYEVDAAMKITGNWSRMFPVKSLTFTAKKIYGPKSFEYQIFPNKEIYKFNSFKARASGNDWLGANVNGSLIRDELMSEIVAPLNIETQAYRQAVIIMNGDYFGIINLKEKIDEHYLSENENVDKDSVELLYGNAIPEAGDSLDYMNMLDFLASHDMSQKQNYDYIKSKIDIDNFIKFELTEIYFYNWDWPSNNIRFWRPVMNSGKWRWILYDMEVSFGLLKDNAYTFDALAPAIATNGPDWPNPPWSTFLLRKLLMNVEFRNSFINYFADAMNSAFLPQIVNQKIAMVSGVIENEIDYHVAKWGNTKAEWQNQINALYTFSNNRQNYMPIFIREHFGISSSHPVKVSVSDANQGNVKINSIIIPSYPWTGNYFNNIPVTITAMAKPGYKFLNWSGTDQSSSQQITMDMKSAVDLTAHFEPDLSNTINKIQINEINYKSDDMNDGGDWIELCNTGTQFTNISGWHFSDSDSTHKYYFPQNTIIGPQQFIVIAANYIKFSEVYPGLANVIGNFNFGLSSSGESLMIYDINNVVADSLHYEPTYPWPAGTDGTGYTISLVSTDKDNSNGANWQASVIKLGTPGRANDNITSIETRITGFELSDYEIYPNPFAESVSIIFYNENGQNIKLRVYSAEGKLVCLLANKYFEKGIQKVNWNGTNSFNYKVPPGIYIIKLQTPKNSLTGKLIKIR